MSFPDNAPTILLGESAAFLDALAHASAAAPLDRPLLVIGERGSGKELFAERIHFLSRRWDQPFVKLNCAALSEDLLDSELFGHEPGAFTGATRRHAGRFERADGGTLFLDEIGTASLRVQEKILRVIEYGEYERVGGGETRHCDVRVVGATNVDLEARAADGRFRADLLDRLAFDVVTLPPLRARTADIPLLADAFGKLFASEIAQEFPGFTPEAMAALVRHGWPGNVRELRNAVERSFYRHVAAGRGRERIATVHIDPFASAYRMTDPNGGKAVVRTPSRPQLPLTDVGFTNAVAAFERELVEQALAARSGNQREAALALDLTYDQLRGLMKKHRIPGRRKAGQHPPAV